MRDGLELAKIGRPVVVVVQAVFEAAARTQAKVLGIPGLPICAYPSIEHLDSAQIAAVSADLADRAIRAMVSTTEK